MRLDIICIKGAEAKLKGSAFAPPILLKVQINNRKFGHKMFSIKKKSTKTIQLFKML